MRVDRRSLSRLWAVNGLLLSLLFLLTILIP
jgi:hypothetical protein